MDDLAMNIMLKKPPVTMYTQKELLCINKGSERSNSLRGLAEGWRSSRLTAERKKCRTRALTSSFVQPNSSKAFAFS